MKSPLWFRSLVSKRFAPAAPVRRPAPLRVTELEDRSVPATHTWVGGGSGNLWSDPTNWAGGAPAAGEADVQIVFNTAAGFTQQDVPGLTIDTLTFQAGSATTVQLAVPTQIDAGLAGPDIVNGGGTNTILSPGALVIVGDASDGVPNLDVRSDAGTLDIATEITGPGADYGLYKDGAGTLRLSGLDSNTYTGATTVAEGTLELDKETDSAVNAAVAVPGVLYIGFTARTPAPSSVVLLTENQLAATTVVQVAGVGLFDVNGQSESFAGLTTVDGGRVVGPGTLTVSGAVALGGGAGDDAVAVTSGSANAASVSVNAGAAFTLVLGGSFAFAGNGGNDLLTLDNSDGVFNPAGGIAFDGGAQSGGTGDSLEILGGTYTTVTYGFTPSSADGHNGAVDLDYDVGDGTPLIVTSHVAFTGLEPISNTGSARDVVLSLPAGDNAAVLEDAGEGQSRLRSLTGTFEDTTFTTPFGSITVVGNGGNDAITVTGVGLGVEQFPISVILSGGDGDDAITVADTSGGVQFVTVDGGAGADSLTVVAGADDDTIQVAFSKAGGPLFNTTVTGAGPTVNAAGVEAVAADGGAGENTVYWADQTGGTYGTAADPSGGIFVRPTGPASGGVTVGTAGFPTFAFTNMAGGLAVLGGTSSGYPFYTPPTDLDVVTVLGISTTGLGSPFGEATAADGADVVTVTELVAAGDVLSSSGILVTIRNASLGALVPVLIGDAAGVQTAAALFVRTGNEAGPGGDTVTADPTDRLALVVDGMGPRLTTPGDVFTPVEGATLSSVVAVAPGRDPVDRYTLGTATVTFTHFENQERLAPPVPGFVVGSDNGGVVTVYGGVAEVSQSDLGTGFDATRVAGADFNNDGVMDAVVGTGVGSAPKVVILDGKTQTVVATFVPFGGLFTGGVFVAAGDINGDGVPDFAVSAGTGGGSRVQVYLSGPTGFTLGPDFIGIEDSNFRGGSRVAIGDVDADGYAELIVAAGPTGGPRVAVYKGQALAQGVVERLCNDFFVLDPNTRTGAFVAAGDIDGDGYADLVFGAEAGGGPRVTVFGGLSVAQQAPTLGPSFFAAPEEQRGGIRVAVHDLDGDSKAELIVGAGAGMGSRVRIYAADSVFTTPRVTDEFDWVPGLEGGVYVG